MSTIYLVRHGQASFGTELTPQIGTGWNEYQAWELTDSPTDPDPRAQHDSQVFQAELERGAARWAGGQITRRRLRPVDGAQPSHREHRDHTHHHRSQRDSLVSFNEHGHLPHSAITYR